MATNTKHDWEDGTARGKAPALRSRASTWASLPSWQRTESSVYGAGHTTRSGGRTSSRPHSSSVCGPFTRKDDDSAPSVSSRRPKTSGGRRAGAQVLTRSTTASRAESSVATSTASCRPRLASVAGSSLPPRSVGSLTAAAQATQRRLSRANSFVKPSLSKRRSSSAAILPSAPPVDEINAQESREKALARFSRAVRLVSVFATFCRNIRQYAGVEKTANYDLYYVRDMMVTEDEAASTQQASETAAGAPIFDKKEYSRENTLYLPLWARWICYKSPENRTEAEVHKLLTLLRGMKSFSRFSKEAQINLCRTMTYACFERRRILVRQGDPGFCLYFIVSGTVSVTVTRRDHRTGVYGTTTVAVLGKNEAFGEVALFSAKALRTASVICRERVEVLVVNREVVLEYCPDVFLREYEEKFATLRKHPLFKDWHEDTLNTLCIECHIREFSHGRLIDLDSTKSDALYFIIKGKVEMMRQVNLSDIRALKVSVNMYGDKPLPRPATARAKSRCAEVVYVRVGCLQDNDVWDLTSLDGNPTGATGNILLSAGVRLLRVPKRLVHELSPKGQVTHFLQGHTPRQRCLTETEVQKHYLSAQTWIEYRKKVLDNVMDISRGRFIAHVSPTAKGSTGWSVWPGTKEQSQGFGI